MGGKKEGKIEGGNQFMREGRREGGEEGRGTEEEKDRKDVL
jgi:hypothetical protein